MKLPGRRGDFRPALCEIEGQELRVFAEAVPAPVAVRYAWVNYGKAQVFGEGGLPLAPFSLSV